MFESVRPNVMIAFKSIAFLLVFIVWLLPLQAMIHATESGNYNLYAFFPLFIIFGVVPVIDAILGKDPANPSDSQVEWMSRVWIFPLFTLAMVPWQYWALYRSGDFMANTAQFDTIGYLGWMMSVGACAAIIGINVAHELIHKDSRIEQWAGGLLLASVCYAGFKVEHVRGHHVHVSTPEDASSSRYNQSLYAFLPKAYVRNFTAAWKLEAARLARLGLPAAHWRNELIWWYGISLSLAAVCGALWGWMGVLFFFGQSFFAATLLEIVNYIEHYGLHRRRLENGKYERVTPAHSWNSNHLFTNVLLFHLQRHSDHHANPKRRYQVLRHFDESPQLPNGYAGMVVLAMVPPLWFRVMNPRVEAYYKGEEWQLSNDQFAKVAKRHTVESG